MTAARALVAIVTALVCGAAVCATPAGAAVFEFTLGSEPEVTLSSFALSEHGPAFAATARLDASTAKWVQDAATAKVFETAEVTVTLSGSVRTFDFSGVSTVSVSENTLADRPTISAVFAYRTISPPAVPEPSIWAMLLLGGGALAIGGGLRARRALVRRLASNAVVSDRRSAATLPPQCRFRLGTKAAP
jgi:hypothetical protein